MDREQGNRFPGVSWIRSLPYGRQCERSIAEVARPDTGRVAGKSVFTNSGVARLAGESVAGRCVFSRLTARTLPTTRSLVLHDDNLQRAWRRTRSKLNRVLSLFERKLVGDKSTHVQTSAEDQFCHFVLQSRIRRIAADHIFFLHTHRRSIQLRRDA